MPFQIIRHQETLLNQETPLENLPGGGGVHFCIAYPNLYRAAMSNLGFQAVYSIVSHTPGFYCDRTFLPTPPVLKLFGRGTRTLMGWQSEKPVQEFDVLAFSVSYEPDYLNLLKMLDLAGIPKRRADRNKFHPLIIAGGAAVTLNPEVMADFVDLFVVGEGETVIPALLNVIGEHASSERKAMLTAAAQIPGVYVPSFYQVEYDHRGYISKVTPSCEAPYPVALPHPADAGRLTASVILTPNTEFENTHLVEISRGCPFNCAFCCVGRITAPYRTAPFEDVTHKIDRGLEFTGRVGLLGAAVGSHPDFEKILDHLESKNARVSFASVRAEALPDRSLEKMHHLGQNLLTLAPETGSDELRKMIGKGMTNNKLFSTVQRALSAGFDQFRLYLMLGLPGETDDDARAAVDMISKVHNLARETGARVMVSVNQFVPKPRTPLELFPLTPQEDTARRLKIVQTPFINNPGVRFKWENPMDQFLQAFLCRGNRKSSRILEKVYQKPFARAGAAVMKLIKNDPTAMGLIFKKIPDDALAPWHLIAR